MLKIIYLVGHINPERTETYEWREEVETEFEGRRDIELINPCTSKYDQKWLAKSVDDPERLHAYRKKGNQLLVPKSCYSVERSTMAIVNLNMYESEAPSIGTIYECSWYWERPSKPVIGIFDGNPNQDAICNHPFIRETIHVWTKTVKEACRMVDTFF